MQSEKGSATVPVALFGVSPNSWCGRFHSPFDAQRECCQPVGETPTVAVETTALPMSFSTLSLQLQCVGFGRDLDGVARLEFPLE